MECCNAPKLLAHYAKLVSGLTFVDIYNIISLLKTLVSFFAQRKNSQKRDPTMSRAGRQPDEYGNSTYLTELQNSEGRMFFVLKTIFDSDGEIVSEKELPVTSPHSEPNDGLIKYLLEKGFAPKDRTARLTKIRNSNRIDEKGHATYVVELQDASGILLRQDKTVYCFNKDCLESGCVQARGGRMVMAS